MAREQRPVTKRSTPTRSRRRWRVHTMAMPTNLTWARPGQAFRSPGDQHHGRRQFLLVGVIERRIVKRPVAIIRRRPLHDLHRLMFLHGRRLVCHLGRFTFYVLVGRIHMGLLARLRTPSTKLHSNMQQTTIYPECLFPARPAVQCEYFAVMTQIVKRFLRLSPRFLSPPRQSFHRRYDPKFAGTAQVGPFLGCGSLAQPLL